MTNGIPNLKKVLLWKHVRKSKYEPSVVGVELLQANPEYACIQKMNGRENLSSLRDLAPLSDKMELIKGKSVTEAK